MPDTVDVEPPSAQNTRLAETIGHLSRRLIALQRPLRLLDALQWDPQVEHTFLSRRGCELPRITRDDYLSRRLPFDPDRRQMDFQDLERDVTRTLGNREGVGRILTRMCREYIGVIRLIAFRGTRMFAELSARLFGTARSNLGHHNLKILDEFDQRFPHRSDVRQSPLSDSSHAMMELTRRLTDCFAPEPVRVRVVDRLASNAAAGSDYLKLRRDASFSPGEIRLLEVHEGWVHLGTSFNARQQPVCAFLRQCPPSSTRTQEGLAVLTEFLAGASHPDRLRRLRQRADGIQMAENGADFLQVFRQLRNTSPDDRDCYRQTARVFRGSLPAGCGPFTKDLSYVQGLGAVVHALRANPAHAPLLFSGKAAVEDLDTLAGLARSGLLQPPQFVPPPFRQPIVL